jgi:polyisoprenoid-binding protein YceI
MKSKLVIMSLVALFLGTVAFTFAVVNLRADKGSSYLAYTCVHKLHTWTGTNKKVDCIVSYDETSNTIQKVVVAAQVADFDSGNASRDSHGLEVLEGLKFPKVTFSSTGIAQTGNDLKIDGYLTFHGEKKWVTFKGTRENKDKQIIIKGKFNINMTDFKVERPSFMMVLTDDKMDIEFSTVFITK